MHKKYILLIMSIFTIGASLALYQFTQVSAINSVNEGFRAVQGIKQKIDITSIGGVCRRVKPSVTAQYSYDYFIPTKSTIEWSSFLTAAPSLSIALDMCIECSWSPFPLKSGGTSSDIAYSTAIDPSGNVLVTGYFGGTGTTIFGSSLTSSGLADIFVAKLDPSGNPLWVRQSGGTSDDTAYSTAIDSSGNVLVTGYFSGTGTTIFGSSLTSSGLTDIFLAKLDPSGNPLWVRQSGGTSFDIASSTAIDSSGNVLVTGYFLGTGTSIFGSSLTSSGSYDIFLAKLDPSGNPLWVRQSGGTSDDNATSTATDSSGNVLVTGYFSGTGTTIFGSSLTSSGSYDIFLAKLDLRVL